MNLYINDDELLLLIFKFLQELVNNRSQRLRFDSWNINGLYAFKDSAKIVIRYLQITNNLKNQQIRRDVYKEKFKLLTCFINILSNCINGGFINFALCEYYNDGTFSQLCTSVLDALTSIDIAVIQVRELSVL